MTLRAGLLDGRRVGVAGAARAAGGPTAQRLSALGAVVRSLPDEALDDEDRAAAWVTAHVPLDALVVHAGDRFGAGGPAALTTTLGLVWRAVRAVAIGAMIEAGRPGRLLLVAPRGDAGSHAAAARAGLENLARSLSVEWARFHVTTVTIAPAGETGDELAELIAFLISPAGAYFSGCRFDLGTVPGIA